MLPTIERLCQRVVFVVHAWNSCRNIFLLANPVLVAVDISRGYLPHHMCVSMYNVHFSTCVRGLQSSPVTSHDDFSTVTFFCYVFVFSHFLVFSCNALLSGRVAACDKRQWLRCGLRQWLQWLQCGPPRQIETCASQWPMAFGHCCWGETAHSAFHYVQLSATFPHFPFPPPLALRVRGVALNVRLYSFKTGASRGLFWCCASK